MIVIATDGSASAREAVRFGLELAREGGKDVTFVHVVDAPPEGAMQGPAGPLWDWPETKDYKMLGEAAALAAAEGVPAKTLLLCGETVEEILSCADSLDADFVVVGSRGFGPLRGALLGSVSRGLLHKTRRPVLVVPGAHARTEGLLEPSGL